MIDWILSVIRNARSKDPNSEQSKILRGDHNYGWFEVFTLDEETFEFKLQEEVELYVHKNMFAEGHFHEVNLALQRRQFVKEESKIDDIPMLKEVMLAPPKKWVIKKVKDYRHINQVPHDIAKQYFAVTLANEFSLILKETFPYENIFLKYI